VGPRQDSGRRVQRRGEHAHADYDNGWIASLVSVPQMEFDKSIVDFPNIKRFPGGASNDMVPNLQDPANPLPLMDIKKVVGTIGAAD